MMWSKWNEDMVSDNEWQDNIYYNNKEEFRKLFEHKRKVAAGREIPKIYGFTIDYLMELLEQQEGRCAILKAPLDFIQGTYDSWFKTAPLKNGGFQKGNMFQATVDRIDSHKPYEKGNVHIVCNFVNQLKGSCNPFAFEWFLQMIACNQFDGCGYGPFQGEPGYHGHKRPGEIAYKSIAKIQEKYYNNENPFTL